MKMNQMQVRVFGVVAVAVASWLAAPCDAGLVYYLPFDNGASSTLTNYGSAGGGGDGGDR